MGPKSAKSAKYRVFCGYTWKTPGIPGKYPATAWVSCRFPQFCVRFCPRPALRLRETREFPEWSTKHPLFSLEISGNAKCWGPSVFLFVCRKSIYRPNRGRCRTKVSRGPFCRPLFGGKCRGPNCGIHALVPGATERCRRPTASVATSPTSIHSAGGEAFPRAKRSVQNFHLRMECHRGRRIRASIQTGWATTSVGQPRARSLRGVLDCSSGLRAFYLC